MKFGKKLLEVAKAVAPGIAATVGGPFGGIAAAALHEVFGTDDDSEIEKQLAIADPSALLKLKEAEMAFQTRRQELGISDDALYTQDTQDARGLAKVTGILPQISLTLIAMVIYGVLLLVLFTSDGESKLNGWQQGQLGILIGVLTTALMQSWNFFFGTSKGSKDKADQLAAMSR